MSQTEPTLDTAASRKRLITRRALTGRDRRLHRRVAWRVHVRGITDAGEEFAGETLDVGAGGIRLVPNAAAHETFPPGSALVIYLDDIGRVEGLVRRITTEGAIAIKISAPGRKRDKIADQLTWLINRDRLGLKDERGSERRASDGEVMVSFGSAPGKTIACRVTDVSLFGAALSTSGPRPLIGEAVRVNDRTGVCARYTEAGFAIDFRRRDLD
ncbi:pilus assembly protein PilZ [bacterium]|nr:pilus assembly protein PilZ [bacterium]